MIVFKEGVDLCGLQPQTDLAIQVLHGVCLKWGHNRLVITSINDGKHSSSSRHYVGLAFDARTRDMRHALKKQIVEDTRLALGAQFDVLFEDEGGANEHLHIEWDPGSSATF